MNIIVNRKRDIITVAVEDNGKGFSGQSESQLDHERDGFGLFSVRERLIALGGGLRIVSEEGNGSMLIMSCPRKLKHGDFHD